MKGMKTVLMAGLALLLLGVFIAFMAGVFNDRIEPGLAAVEVSPAENLYRLETQQIPIFESVPASVEARETTIVAARLLARIEGITVRAGDYVEAGQLLVQLERSDLEAREGQAQERIRSVQARVTEAQQTLQRARELRQRQLIAEADLDAAEANAVSLEAQLAAARQNLAEARAALDYADITSPIAGRIVDRFLEPGDTVSPGQKILSLYNPFSLRVEAWVRESLALALEEGQPLAVFVPSRNRRIEGRIEEIVPAADPGSRAFRIKVVLAGESGLLPGMYARLEVPAGEESRLLVPAARVARVGQLSVVWVQEDRGATRRFVRLGEPLQDGRVPVISGLAAGDRLLLPPARGASP
jgi:membrane fusion protein (multidrug efflux system)